MINLAKIRAISSVVRCFLEDWKDFWMFLISRIRREMSPDFHSFNLCSREDVCCLAFERADGFCSIKVGNTMNTLIAIEFILDWLLNWRIQKASSLMNSRPAFPDEILNRLRLYDTTSSYMLSMVHTSSLKGIFAHTFVVSICSRVALISISGRKGDGACTGLVVVALVLMDLVQGDPVAEFALGQH